MQLAVLVVANLVATVTRFLGLRLIFRSASSTAGSEKAGVR